MAKVPAKIDIGPVYNVDPSRRAAYNSTAGASGASAAATSTSGFAPMERELVFDIDLTDYDDVRTCGTGGHTCRKCWPLMAAAVAAVDAALREDFGFSLVLWVFSGRRGVHAWVCDPRARYLTDEQRSAVASNLSLYKGVEDGIVKLALPGAGGGARPSGDGSAPSSSSSSSHASGGNTSHPSVARSVRLLRPLWETQILPRQKLLDSAKTWDKVLGYVPDSSVASRLKARWEREGETGRENAAGGGGGEEEEDEDPEASLSLRRWRDLEAEVSRAARPSASDARDHAARDRKVALSNCLDRAMLACAYPRLDVDVSKKRNHLLKAPFCVHPKTGKVCVPLVPSDREGEGAGDVAAAAASFDVDAVPTAAGLLDSLDDRAVAEKQRKAAAAAAGAGPSSTAAAASVDPAAPKWVGTALEPYVRSFEEFVQACSAKGKAENARRAAARRAAAGETSLGW